MKSWQIVAELRCHAGTAAALVAAHLLAAVLPWTCRVAPGAAAALTAVALALLPLSWRLIPVWGCMRGLILDSEHCVCRDATGWWPAQIDRRSRVYSGLVFLSLATAGGRVEALLTKANFAPRDFRRLKALVRCRDGSSGPFW